MSDLFEYLDDPKPMRADDTTLADVFERARKVDVVELWPGTAIGTDDIEIIPEPVAPPRRRRRLLVVSIAASIVLVGGTVAGVAVVARDDGQDRVTADDDERDVPLTTTTTIERTPTTPITPLPPPIVVPEVPIETPPTTIDTTRAHDLSQVLVTTSLPHLYLAPGASAQVDWTIENRGTWWIELGTGVCHYAIPPTGSVCSSVAAPPPGTLNDGLAPGRSRTGTLTVTAPADATPGDYLVTIAPLDDHEITATVYDRNDSRYLVWPNLPPQSMTSGGQLSVTRRVQNPNPWPIRFTRGNDCTITLESTTAIDLPLNELVCTQEAIVLELPPGAETEFTFVVSATRNGQPIPIGNYSVNGAGAMFIVLVNSQPTS